jgi:hypothetical protein
MITDPRIKELTAEQTVWYYRTMFEIMPEIKKLEEISSWQSNNQKA